MSLLLLYQTDKILFSLDELFINQYYNISYNIYYYYVDSTMHQSNNVIV